MILDINVSISLSYLHEVIMLSSFLEYVLLNVNV